MDIYADILRTERYRTMSPDYDSECESRCPVCNSADWDFLIKDCHGEIVGCEDCVSKVYIDEILN